MERGADPSVALATPLRFPPWRRRCCHVSPVAAPVMEPTPKDAPLRRPWFLGPGVGGSEGGACDRAAPDQLLGLRPCRWSSLVSLHLFLPPSFAALPMVGGDPSSPRPEIWASSLRLRPFRYWVAGPPALAGR